MPDCGLVADARLEREASFTLGNGAAALADLLDAHRSIDAIFYANDILAAGGLFECHRRSIAVPEALGIAGFHDVELAAETVPALTSVRIPRYEIGAMAARLILERLAGREPTRTIVDLGFEIVARASTRAVAALQPLPAADRAIGAQQDPRLPPASLDLSDDPRHLLHRNCG